MSHHIGPFRVYLLAFLSLLITAEIIWSWKKEKGAYEVKETLSNLAVFAGFQLSKYLFAAYQLTLLGLFAGLAPFRMPHKPWVFVLTFIIADFIYYWFHRLSHSSKVLWAFHMVHHSVMRMNLTSAYRLNWFSAIVSPLFFVPAALLGLPIDFIVLAYALNLGYQFFLHTEVVGKLGAIERVMDTPSSHRVHHGCNPIYIDKNFGGVFIIWDRLFHTYQPETEKVNYGLTTGFLSYNPFKLIFRGFVNWFRPMKTTASVFVLLFSICTLFMLSSASAQDSTQNFKGKTPEQRAQMQTTMMQTRLNLDSAQTLKVQAINLKYAQELGPVISGHGSRFAKYRKIKSIQEQKNKELKAVFSKDQYKAYEQLEAEIKEKTKAAYHSQNQ